MKNLLEEITKCTFCEPYLEMGANPIVSAHKSAKIIIIGQAPGIRVHQSGIPWNDPSGNQLRKWLGVTKDEFYDATKFAIVPMGFCYPGKGKSGDLPPRKECAPKWHNQLFAKLTNVKLILLVGMYAQKYYLQETTKKNLTETVNAYKEYLPQYFVLPHPSPRNRFWLTKNPWFINTVIPELKREIRDLLK